MVQQTKTAKVWGWRSCISCERLTYPFSSTHNIGLNFLQTEVNGDIVSQIYSYDLVPMIAVATLTILEIVTIIEKRTNFSFLIETKLLKLKTYAKTNIFIRKVNWTKTIIIENLPLSKPFTEHLSFSFQN